MNVLVIGCGYAGARIARAHAARGDAIVATTRSGCIDIPGVRGLALDLDAAPPALPAATRVYYTVPPPEAGDVDPRIAHFLGAVGGTTDLVYLGTTGVYGDAGGGSVDETTALAPATPRARRRVHAEDAMRQWAAATGATAAILRIAGIYGPGRLPIARLHSGEPVPSDTGPGNRIHVDDLVAAALAVGDSRLGGAWNVSDGNPLTIAGFSDALADALGLPRPPRAPLDSPAISPGLRSFLAASRFVDNRKLLSLPGFALRYADPVAGILASINKSK